MTNFNSVKKFMEVFGQEVKTKAEFPSEKIIKLRYNLIKEELDEFEEALKDKNLKEVADALTDILYVTYGAGHAFGINLDKCFEEVQNSNMSKLGEDGKPIYNEEGKVISYVLESDKRYISFFAIINNLSDPRIYLSYGPLFYNYVGDFFLNTKSDFFDDLSNIVILFIEYGILMYVLMITFVVYVILLRGSDLKKYMNYILILVVIAPLVVYYPRYLFYLFFFLGVCFSMSHKSNLKIDN